MDIFGVNLLKIAGLILVFRVAAFTTSGIIFASIPASIPASILLTLTLILDSISVSISNNYGSIR